MKNWSTKTNKEKFRFLLTGLCLLAFAGILVYCAAKPDFFWVIRENGLEWYKKRICIFALVFLFGVFVLFANFHTNQTDEKKGTWKSLLFFLLTPVAVFLMMEYANPAGPSLIWNRIYYVSVMRSVVTVLILLVLMGTLFALTNSMRFSGCFLCVFAGVFCIGNYFTNKFRGIPILASDLSIMGTAMNVAGDYKYTLNFECLLLCMFLVIWCILLFRLPKLKLPSGKKRLKYAAGSLVIFAASGYLLIYTPILRNTMHITINTFRPIKSYKKNGAILTFMRSIQLMIVEKPDGYSIQAAENLAEPYRAEAEKADKNADYRTPNIIAVMDEAFADLQAVGSFETSEDVMPFYRSLKEDAVKGFVYVSVFGGQTANTEFEFLTGLSKAFLPESSTPYQLYIKSLLPGLTTHLGAQDYQGMLAFHPYRASGYNRHNVYPNLGFSDFISLEDITVHPEDQLRNHLSDQRDFEMIIEEYEKAKAKSSAPFYLFNVTMQNHSPYDKDFDNFAQPVSIEPAYDDPNAKRYLNLIRHSDEALKYLVEYFKKVDDPTVIVFFGDHEPGLSDDFYSSLFGQDISTLDDQQNLEMYKTPFLIWANYDIEEKENVHTSINYLSSMMLVQTGMKLSPFHRFLLDMSEDVPILTSHGYYGSDGKFYSLKDTESPYYPQLSNYHILQYNDLFDKKHRIAGFFD